MPTAWFDSLERPDGGGSFTDEAHLASFGYIPAPPSDVSRLPIGFTRDVQSDENLNFTRRRWFAEQKPDEPWMGFNCSACHTGLVTHNGSEHLLEGGQGMGDLQRFLEALNFAIRQTLDDTARFDRFAAKVLGNHNSPANATTLRTSLAEHYEWLESTRKMNDTPLRYGFGRVDAFGHIFNKTVVFANPGKRDGNPSDAPVSYPFLWNSHKQHFVQYNGMAENKHLGPLDYGALGRNSGQVVGVFGEVTVIKNDKPGTSGSLAGYPSTINVNNLTLMELFVRNLQSPKWPDSFPAIDTEKAKQGEALYEKMCSTCHLTTAQQAKAKSTETIWPIRATAAIDRTDIWMACNAFTRKAASGLLEGTAVGYISTSPKPIGANSQIGVMLATMVPGMLAGKKGDVVHSVADTVFGTLQWDQQKPLLRSTGTPVSADEARLQLQRYCETFNEQGDRKLLSYKARPLDGIWATAPYLHNGSVPSLRDLLLPAKDRPQRFWVSREFDPETVGASKTPPADALKSEFRTVDDNGIAIPGNSNAGHEYGVDKITDAERDALLEYLKTL